MVSPIPLDSSAPKATADLMVPWKAGPASVTPRCRGVVALGGQQFVCGDHDDGIVVLDADLDVAEAVFLEQRGLPQRRLHQRLRRGLAVLLHEALVQRAGVDPPDADRDARRRGRFGDLLDPAVELLDVARVDAHGRASGVDGGEDVLGLEVDVGDHRDLRLLRDGGQGVGVLLAGGHATRTMSQPDAVSSAICCSVALMSCVLVVHIDCTAMGVIAADTDIAHHQLARLAAGGPTSAQVAPAFPARWTSS